MYLKRYFYYICKTQTKEFIMNANRIKNTQTKRFPKRIYFEMQFSLYLKSVLKELKIKC